MSVDPRLQGYLVAEQGDDMCLAVDCDIDIDAYISLRDRDFEGEYEYQCDLDNIGRLSKFTLNSRQAVALTDFLYRW